MNERIRELATEVGISVDYLTNTKQIVLLEKFAELIVKECMTTIEQNRFRKAGLLDTEYDDGYVDGMGYAERILKEHFGVE